MLTDKEQTEFDEVKNPPHTKERHERFVYLHRKWIKGATGFRRNIDGDICELSYD